MTAVLPTSFTNFGELLKFLRRRARLSQKELSIAVGYSEGQISRLEQNQRLPDMASLVALFVPALVLEEEPEWVARLVELAAAARGESRPTAVSFTRTIHQEITEEVRSLLHNLPTSLSSFVGREQETADLHQRLPQTRLITLTGVGGAGKTRLALQLARQAIPLFPDGVWLVDLAALADAALVAKAVALAVGVLEAEGRPLLETLIHFLRPKQLLLLLDNCEHVITAVAELSETLLQSCPRLHVVATSRERLNILGEYSFALPPLALPPPHTPPENVADFAAIQLFQARAQHVWPDFLLNQASGTAVAEICRRLDGIPLAIELAAAQTPFFQLEEIATRLHHSLALLTGGSRTQPRHHTLQAAIAWSYRLLSPGEQALFRQLAVFAGGWTAAAAEFVFAAEASTPLPATVSLLTSLIQKSLVVVERQPGQETRYRFLQTIQQFARQQLTQAEETAVCHRHLHFFLHFAEAAERHLQGQEQKTWYGRIQADLDNLRAAMEWALTHDPQTGSRIFYALHHFGFVQGQWEERRQWAQRYLAVSMPPSHWLGRFFLAAADLLPSHRAEYFAQGLALCEEFEDAFGIALFHLLQAVNVWWLSADAAKPFFEQAVARFRQLGDDWHLAMALIEFGEYAQVRLEDRQLARALMDESLTLRQRLGDQRGIAMSLAHLADVAIEQGDLAATEQYSQQALWLAQELDDAESLSWILNNLGVVRFGRGEFAEAVALLQESLRLSELWGNTLHVTLRRYWLAMAYYWQGALETAVSLLRLNLTESQTFDLISGVAASRFGLAEVARQREEWQTAHDLYQQAMADFATMPYEWGVSYCLEGLAAAAAGQNRWEEAAAKLSEAEQMRQTMATVLLPVEQKRHDALVTAVCQALK